jgi:Uma2 family endonuclease
MTSHRIYTVREYLEFEESVATKHEYVDGAIYPRPSECIRHNRIATNLVCSLHERLRGNKYWAHTSATRLRIRMRDGTRFYYADGCIVSRPNPPQDIYQDEVVVIAEVVSKQTARIDANEKKDAYLSMTSLEAYLLVEQDYPLVVAYHRIDNGFVREVYAGLDASIPLNVVGFALPLSDIYLDVDLNSES